MRRMDLPLVSVRGTPAECGEAYGAAAREQIQANLAAYRRRFADQAGLDEVGLAAAGEAFRDATVAHHPRIAAMLDAVAGGAGVSRSELYALNARTELLYGQPGEQECTAIGVLGTHTATGHLLLAQNWDWHPDQRQAVLLLETIDEHGHRVLTMTEAGMLAKTGLNSAGLGQCLTMLICDRDGRTDPAGVPYHVLARARWRRTRWGGRSGRLPYPERLHQPAARSGRRPGVWRSRDRGRADRPGLVPGEVGWLNPVDGAITHANHLETRLSVQDGQPDGSSLFRSARAPTAVRRTGHRQSRGPGRDPVLSDHASFPHYLPAPRSALAGVGHCRPCARWC